MNTHRPLCRSTKLHTTNFRCSSVASAFALTRLVGFVGRDLGRDSSHHTPDYASHQPLHLLPYSIASEYDTYPEAVGKPWGPPSHSHRTQQVPASCYRSICRPPHYSCRGLLAFQDDDGPWIRRAHQQLPHAQVQIQQPPHPAVQAIPPTEPPQPLL